MTRLFARLVLCLLIAALPLQGYAAAARACCAPASMSAMTMSGQGDGAHCHHGQAHAARASLSAAAGHHDGANDHGGCHASSCAACCVGFVAAPAAGLRLPLLPAFSLAAPAPEPLLTGPVPAGLERPPRHNAA